MRCNKREIPSELQKFRHRAEKTSIFGFNNQLTLVSYVPKRNKAVILLSSMHHDNKVSGDDKKTDIILHNNATKSGIDNLDHLVRIYTCNRATRRWPFTLFMNVLDVAGVAAYIVWMEQRPQWSNKSNKRYLFLSCLGDMLILPQQQRRLENPRALQAAPKLALQLLGFNLNTHVAQMESTSVQGRCHSVQETETEKCAVGA